MVIEMTKSGEIIRAIQYFKQSNILRYTSYIVSSYHFSMGKKGKAGRSFFSNLPLDLRSSLRSQTLLPLVPGQNINTLESKQDELDKSLGLGPGHDFLPTQPASPSSSVDEDESTIEVAAASIPAGRVHEVVAESSTSATKRALVRAHDEILETNTNDFSMTNVNGQRKQKVDIQDIEVSEKGKGAAKGKGKGKAKAIEDGNRFKGHRWDCTGLVTRYTKPSEMPSELVKCESPYASSPRRRLSLWKTNDRELTGRLVPATIPLARIRQVTTSPRRYRLVLDHTTTHSSPYSREM